MEPVFKVKIESVIDNGDSAEVLITPYKGEAIESPFLISRDYFMKYSPKAGGYYLMYADGAGGYSDV